VVCTSGTITLKSSSLILGFIIFTTGSSPLEVAGKSPFLSQKILRNLLYWLGCYSKPRPVAVRTKCLGFFFFLPNANRPALSDNLECTAPRSVDYCLDGEEGKDLACPTTYNPNAKKEIRREKDGHCPSHSRIFSGRSIGRPAPDSTPIPQMETTAQPLFSAFSGFTAVQLGGMTVL